MSCNEFFFYNELIKLKESHSLLTEYTKFSDILKVHIITGGIPWI